jgi:hypothetical protein
MMLQLPRNSSELLGQIGVSWNGEDWPFLLFQQLAMKSCRDKELLCDLIIELEVVRV